MDVTACLWCSAPLPPKKYGLGLGRPRNYCKGTRCKSRADVERRSLNRELRIIAREARSWNALWPPQPVLKATMFYSDYLRERISALGGK